ncbi:hypothetical protein GGR57DRAFT_390743 [Xylariaceae sp. FL1272]|nr:hypothetical protein GGR57DRAFT_390743 [Xylariaceae sp. FL1272]
MSDAGRRPYKHCLHADHEMTTALLLSSASCLRTLALGDLFGKRSTSLAFGTDLLSAGLIVYKVRKIAALTPTIVASIRLFHFDIKATAFHTINSRRINLCEMGVPGKDAARTYGEGIPDQDAAPPSYNNVPSTDLSHEEIDQLNSAFASLDLPKNVETVTPDTCLAHLKLLFAFQNLKEAIGYADGLWDIYDSRVLSAEKDTADKDEKTAALTQSQLALLREKRWALYVARAVDRYEAWWKSFERDPLNEDDMAIDSERFSRFTNPNKESPFRSLLPPIDVLMIWHAHMLNPRAYLEDCIRHGVRNLWHVGIPWQLVNNAIDSKFNYIATLDQKAEWEETSRRKWDNPDDPMSKALPNCNHCNRTNFALWTTCGRAEDATSRSKPSDEVVGHGYGDADFQHKCEGCSKVLTRDFLEVSRFKMDVQKLLVYHRPMPGTILDIKIGKPLRIPITEEMRNCYGRTFPNRMLRKVLRSQVLDSPTANSIEEIRKTIEATLINTDHIKKIDHVKTRDLGKRYRLGQEARVAVRKMMSRYWGNSSPFALDLVGAVMRQGIFTEKMYKMDWLHSPAARETMVRLIAKYQRFREIMDKYPDEVAVPTLDVDLAWHTHQLSPFSYYNSMCPQGSMSNNPKFIDHDDKIDEVKLSTSFEWTSKTYQALYGEVYSECTCWYCESVRSSHSRFSISTLIKGDKVTEGFHNSGRAALCPPDNSAHISAHNSVQVENVSDKRKAVHDRLHKAHQQRLEHNYERARKRAKRKGRELPPRDEYYGYYWGTPYLYYGPYVYPAFYVCPVYYSSPGVAVSGSGDVGACAAGTCGGTVAAGACAGGVAGGCGTQHSACGSAGGGGVSDVLTSYTEYSNSMLT